MRLLERRFRVKVAPEKAWAHVSSVTEWPSWARHIRRIDLTPAGPLTSHSEGAIHLRVGVRSTFRVEEFNRGVNWRWVGPFLWLTVDYDHRFRRVTPQESEIEFLVDVEGFGVGVLGRLFATIYAFNLDRAIPRLIAEIEAALVQQPLGADEVRDAEQPRTSQLKRVFGTSSRE